MEYNEDGIPICPTCGKAADTCDCWDNEEVHEIIAWRIAEGLYESEHLDVRVAESDDEDDDDE